MHGASGVAVHMLSYQLIHFSIEWCIRRLINITCDISGFGFLGFVLGWMNNIANN